MVAKWNLHVQRQYTCKCQLLARRKQHGASLSSAPSFRLLKGTWLTIWGERMLEQMDIDPVQLYSSYSFFFFN